MKFIRASLHAIRGHLLGIEFQRGPAHAALAARFEFDGGGFVLFRRRGIAVLRIRGHLAAGGLQIGAAVQRRGHRAARRCTVGFRSRQGLEIEGGTRPDSLALGGTAADFQIDASPTFPRRSIRRSHAAQHRFTDQRLQEVGGLHQLVRIQDFILPEDAEAARGIFHEDLRAAAFVAGGCIEGLAREVLEATHADAIARGGPIGGLDEMCIVVEIALVLERRVDVATGPGLAADAHLRIHVDLDRDLAVRLGTAGHLRLHLHLAIDAVRVDLELHRLRRRTVLVELKSGGATVVAERKTALPIQLRQLRIGHAAQHGTGDAAADDAQKAAHAHPHEAAAHPLAGECGGPEHLRRFDFRDAHPAFVLFTQRFQRSNGLLFSAELLLDARRLHQLVVQPIVDRGDLAQCGIGPFGLEAVELRPRGNGFGLRPGLPGSRGRRWRDGHGRRRPLAGGECQEPHQ